MILPTKHISADRALLTVGARLLSYLSQPSTVSALWEQVSRPSISRDRKTPVLRYDAYILTLDLLFAMGAIEFRDGLIGRKTP